MIRVLLRWIVVNCLRRSTAGERCSNTARQLFVRALCRTSSPAPPLRRRTQSWPETRNLAAGNAESARRSPLTQLARDPPPVPQLRCSVTTVDLSDPASQIDHAQH